VRDIDAFFEKEDLTYLNNVTDFFYNHENIWKTAYLPSQERKSLQFNLSEDLKSKAFSTLINRGRLILDLFKYFDCKNFCEVGTAEGYQSYLIADYLKSEKIQGKSYSCDIRDVRNEKLKEEFQQQTCFVSGTSKEVSEKIIEDKNKIDLFWIDGDHRSGAVLKDLIRLAKVQAENCVWVFDDFDQRFGIYNELNFISTLGKSYKVPMGITASNNPNTILIVQGVI